MARSYHPRRQLLPLTIMFAVLALLFGLWAQHNQHNTTRPLELENGTLLPEPSTISPFHLTGTDNQPFTNDNIKGKWSLIFFGFTHCPMLCPTTLSTLNKMYQEIEQAKGTTLPQVVFISVDPERDTPADIQKYVHSFNKHFIGATGSKETLNKLTREMNVLFMKIKKPGSNNPMEYQIDHSGTILMVNPQGKLYAVFSTPHDPIKLSRDVSAIEMAHS